MILAPLRGVTIKTFRKVFASVIRDSGFTEAITPFIPAIKGVDPLKDRELGDDAIPQFIGKDPQALKYSLERIKFAGCTRADLNAGCPYPMIRNKGRGAGLLKTPELLRAMLEVGCEVMGEGNFSLKTRLGVESNEELIKLMPVINQYPLKYLTVHARNAKAMYEGAVDIEKARCIAGVSKVPVVLNGDLKVGDLAPSPFVDIMVGREFIRDLADREDIAGYLREYIAISRLELYGERPVLGRMKELFAYWKDNPRWSKKWKILKICRSVDEILAVI